MKWVVLFIVVFASPGASALPLDLGPLTVHVDVGEDGSSVYASDCSPPVVCEYVNTECEAVTTSGPHWNRTPPVGASVHPECIIA